MKKIMARLKISYHHKGNDSIVIIASDGQGLCTVSIDDNVKSCACIHNLSVDINHRRKGIGNSLLKEAEKVAQEMGASVISLAAAKDKFTADWYKRKGYKPLFSDKEYITFYKSIENEDNQK